MRTKKNTIMPMQLPGALALAAAGAAAHAHAATVQITFTGSYLSTTAGDHLLADFGDDGRPEIVGRLRNNSAAYLGKIGGEGSSNIALAGVFSGILARVGGVGASVSFGPTFALGLVPILFQDDNVRGGAPTNGYVDLTAMANYPGENRITVNRLIFDAVTGGTIAGLNVNDAAFPAYSASSVPEPSSLGLLALGAGGLLTRRRRAMAA